MTFGYTSVSPGSMVKKLGMRRRLSFGSVIVFLLLGSVQASPSAFPETAVSFRVAYANSVTGSVGGELLLAVPFIDASAGLELYLGADSTYGLRLDGTALLFPALGSSPPLAVGLAGDVNLSQLGFAIHAGLIAGSDLLFVTRLPMTASVYLAPGYASYEGFSLAWSAQLRYYFDEFSLELASSDLYFISLALRLVF